MPLRRWNTLSENRSHSITPTIRAEHVRLRLQRRNRPRDPPVRGARGARPSSRCASASGSRPAAAPASRSHARSSSSATPRRRAGHRLTPHSGRLAVLPFLRRPRRRVLSSPPFRDVTVPVRRVPSVSAATPVQGRRRDERRQESPRLPEQGPQERAHRDQPVLPARQDVRAAGASRSSASTSAENRSTR